MGAAAEVGRILVVKELDVTKIVFEDDVNDTILVFVKGGIVLIVVDEDEMDAGTDNFVVAYVLIISDLEELLSKT